MRWHGLIIAVAVITIAGCRGGSGRQGAQPQPEATQPTAAAPAAPAPGGPSAGLVAYPGAKQTGSSSFSGTGPTGTAGQWAVVTLETTDPFEKVRDFYKANAPKGFAQSFSAEQSESGGRNFALWFARADGKAWHTITVQEEKAEGKVMITVASGLAP